jgi:hypothetical protein
VRFSAVLLLLVCAAPAAAQTDFISADRPGIADGSTTIRAGAFQIEAGFEHDHGDDPAVPVLLRYGLTSAFELRLETDDWSDAAVGFKYHFRNEPSLGIIASASIPTGSGDVRLSADFNAGERWSFNPNVGIAVVDDDKDRFAAALAALTVQYNLTDRANVFVDGALQTPEQRHGTSSLILDTGAAWILGNDTQLDVSVGWGAHGETAPSVFWSAGISRRF